MESMMTGRMVPVLGRALLIAWLAFAGAGCVDIDLDQRFYQCRSISDTSCGAGCQCLAAPAGAGYPFRCQCEDETEPPVNGIGDTPADWTWAGSMSVIFGDRTAAGICLALASCGRLSGSLGTEENPIPSAHSFKGCLVENLRDCPGRADRARCVQEHRADCKALVACAETPRSASVTCEAGSRWVGRDDAGRVLTILDCAVMEPGGLCGTTRACDPSGPLVTRGCDGSYHRCEGGAAVTPIVIGTECFTEREPCGSGYTCNQGAENAACGPVRPTPACLPNLAFCEGDVAVFCDGESPGGLTDIDLGGAAEARFDCRDYGYSRCLDGRCV